MRALFRSALGSALAAAVTVASTASIAAPMPAPDSPARTASSVRQPADLASNGVLIAGVGAVVIVLFVLIINGDEEERPTSP